MIKVGNYSFGEQRLAQVIGEGKPLKEAYPNIPTDILAELEKEAAARGIGWKPNQKKKTKKSKNHD